MQNIGIWKMKISSSLSLFIDLQSRYWL